MATIPGTKFTELAPPAETGQIPWSPSLASTGGEQAVTAGIEKMGRAITAYAINTMKQEMAIEASEIEMAIDERGWAARNAVTGDEEADRKLVEGLERDLRAIPDLAKYKENRDYGTIYINKNIPNWKRGIYVESLTKNRENTADRFKILSEELLENGRIPEANDLAEKAYKVGAITQAEYDNFVETAPTESIILSAGKLIDLKQYDTALANLEKLDDEKLTKPQREKKLDLLSKAKAEKKNMSEVKEAEINNDIVKSSDPNFAQRLSYDQIRKKITEAADKGELDGTQIRETTRFLNSIVNSADKSASENDPEVLAEAYKIMTTDKTQKQKFENLMELKPKLKSTTVDGFVKDIYEPETISNEIYKQYSSAITGLKTGKMFSRETSKNISFSVKAQEMLRLFAKQNPDATEKEYEEFFNRLIENQTSWWGIGPGGKSFWNSFRREKGELRYSLPRNIEAMEKETATPSKTAITKYKTGDTRTVNGITYTYDGKYWTD